MEQNVNSTLGTVTQEQTVLRKKIKIKWQRGLYLEHVGSK